MAKKEELQVRMQDSADEMTGIIARAENEKRDLNEEELGNVKRLQQDFEHAEEQLKTIQQTETLNKRLYTGQGRQTQPDDLARPEGRPEAPDEGDDLGTPAANRQQRQLAPNRVQPNRPQRGGATVDGLYTPPGERGRCGFRSLGEFASVVRMCSANGVQLDPRLAMLAGPTAYGSEGVGADGGFAVPPDFRTAIMEKVMAEDELLPRTDQYTSSSNTFVAPKDETTPWGTNGIQAYWEGEAAQKTASKLALENMSVRLNKIISLVPVTDELLEDAPALDTYLKRKAPERISFKINLAILQGTGVGQPLGILGSPATVSVAKESGQTADTIVFNNIRKMWGRLYSKCRPTAVWIMHQDLETELSGMQFSVGSSTPIPIYLPQNSISGAGYSTLFNRPILITEACEQLGTKGDIILADLTKYLTVQKTAGIKSDVSIHLWFDYDVSAFRFVFRVGGCPWWAAPITPRESSNTRSCFVTLDTRA